MFYPYHKKKNNKKNNPSPKSTRRGWARRLKFDTYTTHGLLAEFKELGVRMAYVTRRTRTTPHQNLPEGDGLKGFNLTLILLMGFWLSLRG